MSNVHLCIPPNYSYIYDYPSLGTPMLAGYLKSHGIDAIQSDFNLEYNQYIFKNISDINQFFEKKRQDNYYYSQFLPVWNNDLPYNDNTNSSFYFVERLISSEYLFRYIQDEKENTFLQFFLNKGIEKRFIDAQPDLIGISIISPAQVIGAFTLSYLLKKRLPDIPVVIGGQWPTLFREELMKRADMGALFDFIIIFDGETPLLELVKALDGKASISNVPNLIYKSDSQWVKSQRHTIEDLNNLGCPDFDGFNLDGYKFPYTLTYQSSRECYWNKCSFCVDVPIPHQGYRRRKPKLVIEDLKMLKEKYNLRMVMFSDPAFSPRQMKEISEGILEEKIAMDWWCMSRFDSAFKPDILNLAAEAGCIEVDFGFETASQRLLDFLDKGVNVNNYIKIIKDCYNAGISVAMQTVLGFPSETADEAMDTVAFLVENSNLITGPAFNTYYLTPGNKIYENPEKYGIKFEKDPKLPFKFFHEYEHISGEVTKDIALNLRRIYAELIERKKQYNSKKVFMVEDHHEAYHYWKKMGIKDKIVIHIDAHIDFDWMEDSTPLNVGNYIYKAIREGMIKEFYWVVPSPVWHNPEDKSYLKDWLSEKYFLKYIEKDNGILSSTLLDTKFIISDLETLPIFKDPVILDIDLDFFVTNSMAEADYPHRFKRKAWVGIEKVCSLLKEKCNNINSAVISYSVRHNYTPVEFKPLGDELLTKLSEMVI